ncbi:MAG: VOC family protein [Rhodobacteraceae bacterium]|nr:VOC family protein [Paracoccaceae bacterium]
MSEIHGKIYWSELMTRDYEGAKSFYADVCGWTYSYMDGMESMYALAHAGEDRPVAGIGDMDKMQLDGNLPPHWFTYIAVDDIDAAVAAIKSGGGSLKRDVFEVPNIGRIAIVQDPTGAVIGYIQPAAG